jgi:hypothetical protein
MREKLGLTRHCRPKPFQATGLVRNKFFIFKDENHPYWFVLIPTIIRSFYVGTHVGTEADWYIFDDFEHARAWVADKLSYT